MNAIKITPAASIALQSATWVIINEDYLVGAYKSRQAARDAKAADKLVGSVKNKSEVEFEIVVPEAALPDAEALAAEQRAEDEAGSKPYAFESHGLYRCPHCGIHLDNGVGIHEDEVNGKHVVQTQEKEFWCMACDGEFGPDLPAATEKPAKPAPKKVNGPILHKSEIDHPCKRVWGIASDMKDANPNVKRGAVLAECVAQGIAYYTARTQYQQWLGIQKEMAEREAQQAAAKQ